MITKGLGIIQNGAQILFDVADGSEQCTITMDPFQSAFGGFAILPGLFFNIFGSVHHTFVPNLSLRICAQRLDSSFSARTCAMLCNWGRVEPGRELFPQRISSWNKLHQYQTQ